VTDPSEHFRRALGQHAFDIREQFEQPAPASGGLLAQSDGSEGSLVEVLLAAIEQTSVSGTSGRAAADERERIFLQIIEDLAVLDQRRTYVGVFGRAIRATAEHAAALSPADRRVAAAVIIDRTAATAESVSEFREGIHAAVSVAPNVVHPKLVVDRVLSTTLRHADESRGRENVGSALRVTLESLAESNEASLSQDDLDALRAAVELEESDEGLEELRELGARLHRRDRKHFAAIVAPPRERRRRR
jgi:hypothetical protein